MPTYAMRAGLAGAVVLAAIVAAAGQEQPGKGKAPSPGTIPGSDAKSYEDALQELKGMLKAQGGGERTCNRCHQNKSPQDYDAAGELGLLCQLTEVTTWATKDLHPKAYAVLEGPYGQHMTRLLGKDVTKMKECLVCHATDIAPKKSWESKTERDYYTAGGVACEVCHGSAKGEWLNPHADPQWRNETPAKKVSMGQIDIRDPEVRAKTCASCHVGSAREGKVVTHEMYAAGHPPLPSFELATFSLQEPFHWWAPTQVPYFQYLLTNPKFKASAPTILQKLFHYRVGELVETRNVAVGALVSLREYMQTIADEAAAAAKKDSVLDLTHFDCAACHHDLKRPSWRQKRGYKGVAGRPVMKDVSTQLVEAVLKNAAPDMKADFDAAMDRVRKAFDARPFGDSALLAKEAKAFGEWSDKAVAAVMKTKYTPEQAKGLRDAVAAAITAAGDGQAYGLDYDAARQLTWAYQVIDADLNGTVYTTYPNLERFQKLDDLLTLRLKDRKQMQTSVEAMLPGRLDKLNNFRPDTFFPAFGQLGSGGQ